MEFTVNLEHWRSTTTSIDAVVDLDSKRREGECRVVLADVLTELACFGCQSREQPFEQIGRGGRCGEANLPIATAPAKERV